MLLIVSLVIIFALSWAGVFYKWFILVPWIDIPMHIAGGFCMALLVASYYSSEFKKLSQPFAFFTLLGLMLVIGVFWEFHEFIFDHIFLARKLSDNLNYHVVLQGNSFDTMKDLTNDILGTLLASLALFKRNV